VEWQGPLLNRVVGFFVEILVENFVENFVEIFVDPLSRPPFSPY
jgi:hypothetical protein